MSALLALTACSTDDAGPDRQPAAIPVSFVAVEASGADGALTRASGEQTLSTLQAGGGFGVFAAFTGVNRYTDSSVSPDFMYNEHVAWDGATWTYEPVKFWPAGDGDRYVSFFAYGPYSDLDGSDPSANPTGYCISGFSNAHAQGDPWLTYRLIPQAQLDSQVDLVYARHLDHTAPRDVADRVELEFVHALACVGDVFTVAAGTAMQTAIRAYVNGAVTSAELRLTSVSVSYTLTSKGRLSLWDDGTPNWQTILSGDVTTELTPTLTATLPHTLYSYDGSAATVTDWTDQGHGVFCIPLEVGGYAQQATVTVGYQVVLNGSEVVADYERVTTIPLTDHLQAGAHLSLKASLTPP